MKMSVVVKDINGVEAAVYGIGLSYGITSQDFILSADKKEYEELLEVATKLFNRADKLAPLDGGHNKFLETIILNVSIQAPRYWWQEFDTYRHLSKQSDSTMHTITKRDLTQEDFVRPIYECTLQKLNGAIGYYNHVVDPTIKQEIFEEIKTNLPEGFLQTRMVRLDAMSLRNMYKQRKNHKLKEWQVFFEGIKVSCENDHKEFVWEWVTAKKPSHD